MLVPAGPSLRSACTRGRMRDTDQMPPHRLTTATLESEADLRAWIGEPTPLVCSKIADRVTSLTRRFIESAPLVCVATSDAKGTCDVSPRGDHPGFVRILDESTLLIPERPGNRIADTLRNVLQNPHIGLLFLIPGVGDSFRVNGRATLTHDRELLAPSTIEGKVPVLGILVDIEEAFPQCSKALLRSETWNPARFLDRTALPSLGEILAERMGEGFDRDGYDRERAARYARREGFY
jgi:uncharacterized protein